MDVGALAINAIKEIDGGLLALIMLVVLVLLAVLEILGVFEVIATPPLRNRDVRSAAAEPRATPAAQNTTVSAPGTLRKTVNHVLEASIGGRRFSIEVEVSRDSKVQCSSSSPATKTVPVMVAPTTLAQVTGITPGTSTETTQAKPIEVPTTTDAGKPSDDRIGFKYP
jgi:hypothetical protein